MCRLAPQIDPDDTEAVLPLRQPWTGTWNPEWMNSLVRRPRQPSRSVQPERRIKQEV